MGIAEPSATGSKLESVISKFKTGLRISKFILLLQKANILLNPDHSSYAMSVNRLTAMPPAPSLKKGGGISSEFPSETSPSLLQGGGRGGYLKTSYM